MTGKPFKRVSVFTLVHERITRRLLVGSGITYNSRVSWFRFGNWWDFFFTVSFGYNQKLAKVTFLTSTKCSGIGKTIQPSLAAFSKGEFSVAWQLYQMEKDSACYLPILSDDMSQIASSGQVPYSKYCQISYNVIFGWGELKEALPSETPISPKSGRTWKQSK